MADALPVRLKTGVAVACAVMALCTLWLLSAAPGAQASESPYCGGQTLGPGGYCGGAWRKFNALYGLGSQASVCVYPSNTADGGYPLYQTGCSPGAGQGVYVPEPTFYLENGAYVGIKNNGGATSVVYGVAYRP
jgi:hypothetical protein